ncbi:hypothetical protein [Burkholderia cepacia]|uniref:hypothetical protein n=1 Tax=Burkholderia cepacia TaxID=292 RepID=UPI0012DAC77B|nr:hypothetical protein [Burkholderia cepacia]EMD9440023.1 hypothetical protein [Burkholderia cepacia]HDR9500648.1 hypothetical protein [Burkholderia cepacia]
MPFRFVLLRGQNVIETKEFHLPHRAMKGRVPGGIQDLTTKRLERITKHPSKQTACIRSPVRAGPGNPDPALRAADLASAVRRIFFCSSLRVLSGSLHFFLRRAEPLSAQSGHRETFAGACGVLYQAFGNSLSGCFQGMRHDSANLAFMPAFLFNGTGSIR